MHGHPDLTFGRMLDAKLKVAWGQALAAGVNQRKSLRCILWMHEGKERGGILAQLRCLDA